MDYEDFVLQLGTDGSVFTVRVARSPAGETEPEVLALNLGDDEVAGVASAVGRGVEAEQAHRNLRLAEAAEPSIAEIGARLFQALFPAMVRDRYQQSLVRVGMQGRGLRIRIDMGFSAGRLSRLHAMPWEYLSADGHFLALSREVSIVRHIPLGIANDRPPVALPLSILVLAGEIFTDEVLDLEAERRSLVEAWSEPGEVRVLLLPDCTLDALREELLAHDYHAIHFMGHGRFSPATGEGSLAFRSRSGERLWISGSDLADQIRDRTSLRLVFLNACETAQAGATSLYSGVATALIGAGVPAVVAMQFPISDAAALVLSRVFYRRVARGDSIDAAMAEGRIAVRRLPSTVTEWGTPVLFERHTTGRMVEANANPTRWFSKRSLILAASVAFIILTIAGSFQWRWRSGAVSGERARVEPSKRGQEAARRFIFIDHFYDNRNHWPESPVYSLSRAKIRNGYYDIFPEGGGGSFGTLEINIDETKDFTIEGNLQKVAGPNSGLFGLVWGLRDNDNFFQFTISGDGHISVRQTMSGGLGYPYTAPNFGSEYVNKGDTFNALTIEKRGSTIEFLVNSRSILRIPFEPFSGGRVGFITYDGVHISADYLAVTSN